MISGSKNPKRIKAFELRKAGKSYNEMAVALGVSKGTVSLWFKDVDWSKDVQVQLELRAREISTARLQVLNEGRRKKRERIHALIRKEAEEEFFLLRDDPLFIAGIFAYWGEGDKKNKNSLRLCNTDGGMIRIYTAFLQKTCNVPKEKIHAWLLLYPDLHEESCKKFWTKIIGKDNFYFKKSIVIQGRHKKNRITNGVCNILVHNTYLKLKMLEWIKLFSENNFMSQLSIRYPANIERP